MKLPFTVRDRDVQSNFDRLAQRLGFERVKVGQISVTWPGASVFSNYITAAHGLGALPRCVVATPNDEAGSGRCAVVAFFDATSITIRLENVAGTAVVGTTVTPVSWAAYA